MDKIKTSEQVKAELEDKKVAKTYLSEFENGIKKELDDFKAVLFDFRPKHEVNHVLDTKEVKNLNNGLNEVLTKLKKINIPNQIEIIEKKENKISFSDTTTKWLSWFCGIAFIVAVGGFCYGYVAYRNIAKSNEEYEIQGIFKGRKQIYYSLPNDSKTFIDKKYPEWQTKK